MIECAVDRRALENRRQDGRGGVKRDVYHDGGGETAEGKDVGEDAAVEEDDGDFGAVDGEFVEDLRGVECLCGTSVK